MFVELIINEHMANKKSFFEKLTNSIKFTNEEDKEKKYRQYEIEDDFDDEDDEEEVERLEIQLEDEEIDEEEIGELSVDMYRIDNAIIIKTMVAGISKSDINITLTRDLLTIEGARKNNYEAPVEEHYFQELYWGAFERTIELPEEVDIEQAEANESHGLLTLVLPLVDKHRQAQLKIK